VTDYPILRNLGFILTCAALAVLVLRLVRVPAIVAYMAAGMLLGPITGVLAPTEHLRLISQVGVALLLFLVGLQLSLANIRGVAGVGLTAGVTQVVLTGAAGYGVALLFGLGHAAGLVVGLAVACSSTVVMVKLLGQRGELQSLHARIGLGISMTQDLATVLALTLLAGALSPAGAADASVASGVALAFGGVALLIVFAIVSATFLLPRLFAWAESSADTVLIWALAWCFIFISAAAVMGLSVELGAFIAGLSLAQLHFAEELRRRVQPLVNFFLAVFFVTLGLQLQPETALQQWPLAIALCCIVLVVKPAIVLAVVPRLGYGARTSTLSSLALGHLSEFSFILAAFAYSAGVLSEATLSVITLTGFITISAASYLIIGSERVYDRLRGSRLLRAFGATGADEPVAGQPLRNHVIVVGMNTLGRRVALALRDRGETVLAIDTDPAKLAELPVHTLLGNVDDVAVLEEARFADARLVISALQIEDTNNLLAFRCRENGIPSAIHAFDPSVSDELRAIGVTHLIESKRAGMRLVAQQLRQAGVLD
jgi:Kef-type K+ transport system membrane component KefB